ncbi:hypothetical protein [Amycolatopsis sp. CA-230715]|uniref:hypothetical protein n=1 Tax=Amycolatopsis sp. CA-230715 TaxID=2745196 RepID=UPI001C02B2A6|nr:hypothetical protein [Amycolatopsis sp. CA-230715]QWF82301.1 hypothetical protein HUW46_05738 [Amycolatopsis sp. CA-230715]
MTDFSEAQFQEVVNKINGGLDDLSGKIAEVPQAIAEATDHWYVPGFVADAITWLGEKIVDLAKWIFDKIKDALKGIGAPVAFFVYAFDWQDIKGISSTISGQVKPEVMPSTNTWKGTAGEVYNKTIRPQGDAASRISSISNSTSIALQLCAGAGLTFYVAIGLVLVKFIVAMASAIAAIGSAIFSWAGLGLIVEEAGVNAALIWGAIGALTLVLGAQAQQLVSLHGEAIDNSVFPGGHWPDPATGSYRGG